MENKMSNYEKNVIDQLENGEDVKKQAERGYRKSKSIIDTQIAQLEGKKPELECKIEDAEDYVNKMKFALDFNLEAYDRAVSKVATLKDELDAIEETIKNRKELLESWK